MAIAQAHGNTRTFHYLTLGLLLGCLLSCNEHRLEPLDQVLSASNRLENKLPAKTKLDFLFVIDDSASMGEEQKALAENFRTFSEFLFDELQDSADYRIAVTNTGVANERAQCDDTNAASGRFLYKPATPERPISRPTVEINGERLDPNPVILPPTADCPASSPVVISSKELEKRPISALPPAPTAPAEIACQDPDSDECLCQDPDSEECIKVRRKLLLEKEFMCHSTLGTQGCSNEKGLEAMRLALSCSGPNAELFKSCCIGYNEGGPQNNQNSFYDPGCVITDEAKEPEFLRPDATLVIIFITDENDCSTPVDNPIASDRFICKPGWQADDDGDGVPDIYNGKCGLPAKDCFELECGPYAREGMQVCHDKRCEVDNYVGLGCEYSRQALVSIKEYRNFLLKLKARPLDQLLVATIVGFRLYLRDAEGELILNNDNLPQELSYSPEQPLEACRGVSQEEQFSAACCPNGECRTNAIKFSCDLSSPRSVDCASLGEESEECVNFCESDLMSCDLVVYDEVRSQPGVRYLDLADSLGDNGLGCPRGDEPTVVVETAQVIEQEDALCVNLCVDDFIVPLRAIKDRVADLLNTYCINRLPNCIVPAAVDDSGAEVTPARACSETDLANPEYYARNISVSRRCRETVEQGGNCSAVENLTELVRGEDWTFSLGNEGCAGVIELTKLPPAGSEIFIDFILSSGESTGEEITSSDP